MDNIAQANTYLAIFAIFLFMFGGGGGGGGGIQLLSE